MSSQTVNIEDALKTHSLIISRAGTRASIRDFALLHSAIERPNATYDSRDLYPTIFTKTAALLQSLCLNHPFTDGNKRTAWAMTHQFLWFNGYHLQAKRMEAADFMIYVDDHKPDIKEIALWLKTHSTRS